MAVLKMDRSKDRFRPKQATELPGPFKTTMPRRLLQDKLAQKLPKLDEYSERNIETWSSMTYRLRRWCPY